jgi:hypothetical protein
MQSLVLLMSWEVGQRHCLLLQLVWHPSDLPADHVPAWRLVWPRPMAIVAIIFNDVSVSTMLWMQC